MRATNTFIETFDSDSSPYGFSYASWTTRWWQWALSIPSCINPVVDKNGTYWATNQPDSDVWFMAGRFGGHDKSYPDRKIKVSSGRSFLFPVLNCEANQLEYPELTTEDMLIDHVTNDVNTVVKKDFNINGKILKPVRIPSVPKLFSVTINRDNVLGVNGGMTNATADGYWIFLKPLPNGVYIIKLEGSCESGRLNAGATYEIEIE